MANPALIKRELVLSDDHWGVFKFDKKSVPHRNNARFKQLMREELGIQKWPTTESTPWLKLGDTFRDYAKIYEGRAGYEAVPAIYELYGTVNLLKNFTLPVGPDDRHRPTFFPFGTVTGRNTPSYFLLAYSKWLRCLIQPPPGRALVYFDWAAQEFGIAAIKSRDRNMIADYCTGDPYIAMGIRLGLLPEGFTRYSPGGKGWRNQMKILSLAILYGREAVSLSRQMNISLFEATRILEQLREHYWRFFEWIEERWEQAKNERVVYTEFG
jgi:hypothetical protein